jgi:hypothetical protein
MGDEKPRCECVCRECAEGDHCGEGKQEGLGDCMFPRKERPWNGPEDGDLWHVGDPGDDD